jgi:hypothetical protein
MRRIVASASGRLRSKMLGQGMRPVDAVGRRAPRQQLARAHRQAVGRAVRRRRPDDRVAVAARHQEQALADGRRAVVAAAQLAVLDHVAQGLLRLRFQRRKVLPLALRARLVVLAQRAPGLELLDVLQRRSRAAARPWPT